MYYDPKPQTSPQSNISSMTNNKIVCLVPHNVSLGVYKGSTFLGAYYGPPTTPSKPISSSVCMLQESWATHKWYGMPSKKTTTLQLVVPNST